MAAFFVVRYLKTKIDYLKSMEVHYSKRRKTLENSINFTRQNENLFLGLNASIYETLKEDYNDKYEYILPEVILDKNLFSNKYGNADFTSNLKVHNFDTNKHTKFGGRS